MTLARYIIPRCIIRVIIINRIKLRKVEQVFITINICRFITDMVVRRRNRTVRRGMVVGGRVKGWGFSFVAPYHPQWCGAVNEKAPAKSPVYTPGPHGS